MLPLGVLQMYGLSIHFLYVFHVPLDVLIAPKWLAEGSLSAQLV